MSRAEIRIRKLVGWTAADSLAEADRLSREAAEIERRIAPDAARAAALTARVLALREGAMRPMADAIAAFFLAAARPEVGEFWQHEHCGTLARIDAVEPVEYSGYRVRCSLTPDCHGHLASCDCRSPSWHSSAWFVVWRPAPPPCSHDWRPCDCDVPGCADEVCETCSLTRAGRRQLTAPGQPPVLLETMVFGGPLDGELERYRSLDGARGGHDAMVRRVREAGQNRAEPPPRPADAPPVLKAGESITINYDPLSAGGVIPDKNLRSLMKDVVSDRRPRYDPQSGGYIFADPDSPRRGQADDPPAPNCLCCRTPAQWGGLAWVCPRCGRVPPSPWR